MSDAVHIPGVLPIEGDQVVIDDRVAPLAVGRDTMTVLWSELCDDHGWADLVGHWSDGRAGRVMVWIDRVVVRRVIRA